MGRDVQMKQSLTNNILKEKLACFAACAVSYIFLDIPFRTMGFLNLLPFAGPKNALPMVTSLVFGPAGIWGSAAGALLSGFLSGAALTEFVSEAVSVAAASALLYRLWYFCRSRPPGTNLKTLGSMLRFFLMGTGAGFVMGGIEGVLLAGHYDCVQTIMVEVGISSSAWLLLIGMPVFILLTSVFAIQPRMPKRLPVSETLENQPGEKDLVLDIGSDVQELEGAGDAVERYIERKKIPAQRGYAIMSCVEELSVLIQQRLPKNGKIHIHISAGSNVVVCLHYPGERYNPFAVRVAPGGPGANLDILGILMVREMAVHVGYRQKQGGNQLTIVV